MKLRLALLSVSMFVLFLIHELVQELVTKTPGWRFGLFMTFVEIGSCTVYPFLSQHLRGLFLSPSSASVAGKTSLTDYLWSILDAFRFISRKLGVGNQLNDHDVGQFTMRAILTSSVLPDSSIRLQRAVWSARLMLVSFLILGSVSLSNLALLWCSYPAKVAFKSAKLIPTMIIGSLLLRKRYSSTHLIAAGCLCVGLIGVTLADKFANLPISSHVSSHSDIPLSVDQVDPSSFDWGTTVGITLLLISIILDSVIPNLQEQLFNSSATAAFEGRTPSSDSVMMCTNLVGVSFLLIPLFGFHQFADAVAFISVPENNHLLLPLILFTFTSYGAVTCILVLTAEAGGVYVVALATVRKVFTIGLSFALFPKIITGLFVLSALIVLIGIVMGILATPPTTRPVEACSAEPKVLQVITE